MLRPLMLICAAAAGAAATSATAGAAPVTPPQPITLKTGWEVRDLYVPPAPPQPPPPSEGEQGSEQGSDRAAPQPQRLPFNPKWRAVTLPDVFDPVAAPELYGGAEKEYRLRFTAPAGRRWAWQFRFEQVRRRATVSLNGKRIGYSNDPYTPFTVAARGLARGRSNTLLVRVDSRKDPRLPEGWWNWGGITRPVTLAPLGRVAVTDPALLPDVSCSGPATGCRAELRVAGILSKLPAERPRYRIKRRSRVVRRGKRTRRVAYTVRTRLPATQPRLTVKLKSPTGRVTRKTFDLRGYRGRRRQLAGQRLAMAVPVPELWSPDSPRLYDATATLTYAGVRQQVERRKVGLRSVTVAGGFVRINNRPVNLRGASIHEDMPGRGAALTGADMDTIVAELKQLGANVTRAHYVLSEGLLNRLDRAGIMVWNQAPVWQRDHGANLLQYPEDRRYALGQVKRTVLAGRVHPAVITHAVANELSFTPDRRSGTRRFLIAASELARELDPTRPVALDIKGRPGYAEQFTYERFDIIGINQYFGWYPWVKDFGLLEPYLNEMHRLYPDKALVNTEFGAEGRADMDGFPATTKGTYAFQEMQERRTLDLIDRLPYVAGAIHWTLREFEIFPGWLGGVTEPRPGRNTRHYKGLLTYAGERKPAWQVAHDHFVRTPLYR